ncbi:MAG: ATP-binding protein [Victivallales bacterium]|nr:ATP-binding protein [Victivallales bacterium]
MNKNNASFLPFLLKNTGKYTIFLISVLIGMLVGIFILFPLHEIAIFYDKGMMLKESLTEYLYIRVADIFQGRVSLIIIEFWTIIGAFLGILFYYISKTINKNSQMIRRLSTELEKSFPVLLAQGESSILEFKSSFRWDYQTNKINKNLENVIVKTIAAFLNSDGGTLLIGVNDNNKVLGLENDYNSLKKPGRDGFEQAIISSISAKMGSTVCGSILTMFHSLENKDVCRIIAMPSPRPVYVKDGTLTKFYIRTGCSTRELNLKEAVDYISMRWNN